MRRPHHPHRTRARGASRDQPPPLTSETRATPRGSRPSTERAGVAPSRSQGLPSLLTPCPPSCLAAQPWVSSECRGLRLLLVAAASHAHPSPQPAPWSFTVPALHCPGASGLKQPEKPESKPREAPSGPVSGVLSTPASLDPRGAPTFDPRGQVFTLKIMAQLELEC